MIWAAQQGRAPQWPYEETEVVVGSAGGSAEMFFVFLFVFLVWLKDIRVFLDCFWGVCFACL